MTESSKQKVCKTCNEVKALTEFSGCGVTPDRRQPNCKPCHEERKRAGKAAASEKRAAATSNARQEVNGADGLCIAPPELLSGKMATIEPETPSQPVPRIDTPAAGVVTKEVVTTDVLRWQAGDRCVPIEELSREKLLGAVRSLFEANGKQMAEFEQVMGELTEAYEQKIHSLHHVLAAHVELEMRNAMRDKMDAILEAVMGEVERRTAASARMEHESKEGAGNER